MIFRGSPTNKKNFIKVDNETALFLQQNGFIPTFIDNKGIYFKRNSKIIEFMERSDFVNENK